MEADLIKKRVTPRSRVARYAYEWPTKGYCRRRGGRVAEWIAAVNGDGVLQVPRPKASRPQALQNIVNNENTNNGANGTKRENVGTYSLASVRLLPLPCPSTAEHACRDARHASGPVQCPNTSAQCTVSSPTRQSHSRGRRGEGSLALGLYNARLLTYEHNDGHDPLGPRR